jgi:hypothetical protein
MTTVGASEGSAIRNGGGSSKEEIRNLPAERAGSAEREGLVLSDAVADYVGDLLANSEEAATAIRYEAQADADLLRQTVRQDAAREARAAVVGIASESLPRLEARVSELSALLDRVRGELEQLTEGLSRLASGDNPPMLPAARAAELPAPQPPQPPPVGTLADRQAFLIALNMANNGASRDEAQRYLVDVLNVSHPDALLDAVYGNDTPQTGQHPPATS